MKKYRCTICGYIYDDAKEKVKFEDLPDDWKCPMCGAPKSLFEEVKEEKEKIKEDSKVEIIEDVDDELRELSNYEISLICSNLARGCEKQYLEEEKDLFRELSKYYEGLEEDKTGSFDDIINMVNGDINNFSKSMDVFTKYEDRGAKRVVNWASKSTNIMKVVIDTYKEKGIDYIKNTKIWVCDICGFVYIGDNPPKVCPVCRVPSLKILEVC
ncbi:MAG TPA: rubredoxin [Candidatus Onthousia faecipullorum]|uniref:Rubredoxin n=1 Tax=Candidatus Onthousia faecipullorum TaxID=2840887 RepID=A0A9D1KBP5_9FIRM|nr:rubredoxin [Candidatus Onthousia faecipullorum]